MKMTCSALMLLFFLHTVCQLYQSVERRKAHTPSCEAHANRSTANTFESPPAANEKMSHYCLFARWKTYS